MTVQTATGAVSIGAGDFSYTHKGITWGVKVRHITLPDGSAVMDVFMAELVSGVWAFKQMIASDSLGSLDSMGVSSFLSAKVIPGINAWLKARYAALSPTPTPVPGLPANVAELDKALAGLKVNIGPDGTPSVFI